MLWTAKRGLVSLAGTSCVQRDKIWQSINQSANAKRLNTRREKCEGGWGAGVLIGHQPSFDIGVRSDLEWEGRNLM
jgi:hypothetical protein